MTAHPKVHAIHDQGPARRKTAAPILLACLKSDCDADRDHVTARLEHVRALRLHDEDAIKELERELQRRMDAIAAIDAEEAELLKVDALLASKQYGLDRLLVEKR